MLSLQKIAEAIDILVQRKPRTWAVVGGKGLTWLMVLTTRNGDLAEKSGDIRKSVIF